MKLKNIKPEGMKSFLLTYHKLGIAVIGLSLVLSVITINKVKAQQSASYTQYMDNLTPLNSTYSLLDSASSVNVLGRTQYVGIDGAPNTFIFNANMPIQSINGAAGLVVNNDNFAVEHQNLIYAYFAKAVQLTTDHYLAVSLDGGFRSYQANYAGLAPGDPAFASDISENKPSVGFGVMYYSQDYYFGVSVPQLNFRDLGVGSVLNNDYFRNHYYLSAAYLGNADQEGDIKIKTAALASVSRGVPFVADVSATLYFRGALGLGIDYRSTGELAGIVSYNIGAFHIGYSYQFGTTTDDLGGISNATHEVTLGYRFGRGALTPKLL